MNEKDQYESLACNCVEVGTLIKEDDTHLTLDIKGNETHSAEEEFSRIEKKAKSVGSGNCQVQSETIDDGGRTIIRAMFEFDCAAEKLIFQMGQR